MTDRATSPSGATTPMDGRIRRATVTLEMDLEGRAPEGALISTDGVRMEFSGWAELASAIEDWRTRARKPVNGSPPEGGE